MSCSSPHAFTKILNDCLSVLFSYHIQSISQELTHFSEGELAFFRKCILCWEFTDNVNVREFLEQTRGRKLTLQYVQARRNPSVDDECSKLFRGIRELDIQGNELQGKCSQSGSRTAFTNAAFENLRGIHSLNISHLTNITSEAFINLRGIKHLKMVGCIGIDDTSFVNLRGIETLDISGCLGITDEVFISLRGIKDLNMAECNDCNITDVAFVNLRGIRRLNVSMNTNITDKAIENLIGIETLNIHNCDGLTNACADYLRGVKALIVNGTGITGSAFRAFREAESMFLDWKHFNHESAPNLRNVRDLGLMSGVCDDASLFTLMCNVEKLTIIAINLANVTDETFRYLRGLKHLSIYMCTQGSLTRHFLKHLTQLERLRLDCNFLNVAEEDVEEVVKDLLHVKQVSVMPDNDVWVKIKNEWGIQRSLMQEM